MVPSSDQRTFPSMKSSVGARYVLMRMVAIDGHKCCTLRRAACLLRELKAAIQPGSQNTHTRHGQQHCHRYISRKWPTCIMTSLCKSAIVGRSIHGVVVFVGLFYSGNGW